MPDETQVSEATQATATAPEAPVAPAADAPVAKRRPARTAQRKGAAKAASKPAPAKAPAKGTKPKAKAQPIPAGMTRSRGKLIPVAPVVNGKRTPCPIAVGDHPCGNPGRWPRVMSGRKILTCTTHKNANQAKQTLFAAPAKRARKAPVAKTA